jgi:hypothetical protein
VDGNSITDQPPEVLIVLSHRAAEIVNRECPQRTVDCQRRQVRVQTLKRRAQIAD